MNNIYYQRLAKIATKAGIILIENGAEAYRVEDTMTRLCKVYGADVIDSYATPTLLIVSFSKDGELYHNIKRVYTKGINLSKIDDVNTLSRQVCQEKIPLEELSSKLDEIDNGKKPYTFIQRLIATAICTFGFAIFFGGNLKDAIVAAIVGILTKIIQDFLDQVEFSAFFNYMTSGALLTLFAIIANYFGLCNRDIVIISAIMLLVPGMAITNSIRDTVSGELVSGLTKAAEAIFIAVAIAVGSGFVLALYGTYGGI